MVGTRVFQFGDVAPSDPALPSPFTVGRRHAALSWRDAM